MSNLSIVSLKSLQMYRISTLSCLQHGSFNVEEAGNCVHFIVYGVKKNSRTPNRGNDSGAITLPNSTRAKPKTDNYRTSSNKIKTNYNFKLYFQKNPPPTITIGDNSHSERFQHNYTTRSSPLKHKLYIS